MKIKRVLNYFNPNDIMGFFNLFTLAILSIFIYLFFSTMPMNDLPSDITPVYKTIENSGFLGTAEYYIFDTNGNRYHVFRDTFDKYNNLPRE